MTNDERSPKLESRKLRLAFLFLGLAGTVGCDQTSKHMARAVHEYYFNSAFHFGDAFAPRTMWSLSNAFTSAFKDLDPIPQFKATAKLGPFLESRGVA